MKKVSETPVLMFKGYLLLFLLITGFGFGEHTGMPPDQKNVRAWIISSQKETTYTFSGRFLNETGTQMSCTYQLKAARSGRSGNSSSVQKGRFTAAPGKEVRLSKFSVNINENDCCQVELSVWQDENVIAGDTLVIGCEPGEQVS